jgi:hypothetical protein
MEGERILSVVKAGRDFLGLEKSVEVSILVATLCYWNVIVTELLAASTLSHQCFKIQDLCVEAPPVMHHMYSRDEGFQEEDPAEPV